MHLGTINLIVNAYTYQAEQTASSKHTTASLMPIYCTEFTIDVEQDWLNAPNYNSDAAEQPEMRK